MCVFLIYLANFNLEFTSNDVQVDNIVSGVSFSE